MKGGRLLYMNKKGISTVVATVLIVLITVAAVTILWVAISPLIDQNLGSGTKCFNAQGKIVLINNVLYTFYNDSHVSYWIERRANSPDIVGLEVYIEVNGETVGSINYNSTEIPAINGKDVFLNETGFASSDVVKIAIAPMVEIDGVATSCGVGSYAELKYKD
jgi:hypothetical protein